MHTIKSITTAEAESAYNNLMQNGFTFTGKDQSTRDLLFGAVSKASASGHATSDSRAYLADLEIGLTLYRLLPPKELTLRAASNDGIWKHLSVEVLPDVVHQRWGDNPTRFWKLDRRIWLKTLWWFIHLSWQGSEEATRQILSGLTTDEIVQLTERPGNGYRVGLYREIMKQLPEHRKKGGQRNIFRIVMKLNTALIISIEPEFSEGGTPGYVRNLFSTAERFSRKTG